MRGDARGPPHSHAGCQLCSRKEKRKLSPAPFPALFQGSPGLSERSRAVGAHRWRPSPRLRVRSLGLQPGRPLGTCHTAESRAPDRPSGNRHVNEPVLGVGESRKCWPVASHRTLVAWKSEPRPLPAALRPWDLLVVWESWFPAQEGGACSVWGRGLFLMGAELVPPAVGQGSLERRTHESFLTPRSLLVSQATQTLPGHF